MARGLYAVSDSWVSPCGTIASPRCAALSLVDKRLAHRAWDPLRDEDNAVPVIVSDSTLGCHLGSGLQDTAIIESTGRVVGRLLSFNGNCFANGLGELARERLGRSFEANDVAFVPMSCAGTPEQPQHNSWQMSLLGGEHALPRIAELESAYRNWVGDPHAYMQQKSGRGLHMTKPAIEFVLSVLLSKEMATPIMVCAGWNAPANMAKTEFLKQSDFIGWCLRNV